MATIGDKSVENRTTSRKSVVRVKFQAPSSPIQCWTKSSSQEQHCMGERGVADGFDSLFTDIFKLSIRVLWIFSRGFVFPPWGINFNDWVGPTQSRLYICSHFSLISNYLLRVCPLFQKFGISNSSQTLIWLCCATAASYIGVVIKIAGVRLYRRYLVIQELIQSKVTLPG